MGILHQEGRQWVLIYDEKMFKLVLDRVQNPLFPVVPVPVPFPLAVSLPAYHVETWSNSLVPFLIRPCYGIFYGRSSKLS